jgi:hypothetical protein
VTDATIAAAGVAPACGWLRARGGLGPLAAAPGAPPRPIAYLGNSLTVQRAGYRPLLHDRLVALLRAPHPMINAGFGGTGSMACLYTLANRVLRHAPGLCFIDCSVGDVGVRAAPATVGPMVEAIIRRLHAIGCAGCILHFHRTDAALTDDHPVIAAYERVADHWGVPSLNLAALFAALPAAERAACLTDVTHLSPAGAALAAERIAGGVAALLARPGRPPAPSAPLHAADFTGACVVPAGLGMLAPPASGRIATIEGVRVVEADAGSVFTFRTDAGPVDGLLLAVGPAAGDLAIAAGDERHVIATWDRWCTYDRLQAIALRAPVAAGTPLSVAVLDRAAPPAPAGVARRLRLIGFLVRARVADPGTAR